MRKYLIRLREKNGMTQQYVANKANISRQYYHMIETGARQQQMDIVLAERLASIFHISITQMIDYEQSWRVSILNENQK